MSITCLKCTLPLCTQAVETQLALKSRDSIVLRKALTDQDYKESFETFLSIQQCEGEKLVNNLHFYAEIQKFKVRVRIHFITYVCTVYIHTSGVYNTHSTYIHAVCIIM